MLVLALSLTLGFVSAEDVAIDGASDVLAADESVEVESAPAEEASVDEEGHAAGGDVFASANTDIPLADVGVVVTPLLHVENDTLWSIIAYNYGPDTAVNAQVKLGCTENLQFADYMVSDGEFDYENGIWYVGDIPAMAYAELLLDLVTVNDGPYFVDAVILSETFDPFLDNNYDVAAMGLEASASAAQETLPATGNPLAMALLALVAVGVGGIRRLF